MSQSRQRVKSANLRIVLPPLLLPSVPVVAMIAAAAETTFDFSRLFDKRKKDAHRYQIADTRGALRLTVPIAHPHGIRRATWTDVTVSDHGEWWNVHRTAWESAYARTPFFEFYADDFAPFFNCHGDGATLLELHRRANGALFRLAGIDTKIDYATTPEQLPEGSIAIDPAEIDVAETPYWQVRADRLGFMTGMSGIDLLFNEGPETPLRLSERIESSELFKNLEARHVAAAL